MTNVGSPSPWRQTCQDTKTQYFTCSNCSLKFSSEKSLEDHRRLVHLVSLAAPEPFCCETCGKESTQKNNMLRHQNIRHHNIRKTYKILSVNSRFGKQNI